MHVIKWVGTYFTHSFPARFSIQSLFWRKVRASEATAEAWKRMSFAGSRGAHPVDHTSRGVQFLEGNGAQVRIVTPVVQHRAVRTAVTPALS